MAGTLTISTLSDGTNSTSSTNPIRGSARAWANFSGTTVINSFNVSSITAVSTGIYTINFTNAMPSTTYAPIVGQHQNSATNNASNTAYNLTTGSVTVAHWENNLNYLVTMYLAVFA